MTGIILDYIIYRNVHKCIYKAFSYTTLMFDMFDGENFYSISEIGIIEEIVLTPRALRFNFVKTANETTRKPTSSINIYTIGAFIL